MTWGLLGLRTALLWGGKGLKGHRWRFRSENLFSSPSTYRSNSPEFTELFGNNNFSWRMTEARKEERPVELSPWGIDGVTA